MTKSHEEQKLSKSNSSNQWAKHIRHTHIPMAVPSRLMNAYMPAPPGTKGDFSQEKAQGTECQDGRGRRTEREGKGLGGLLIKARQKGGGKREKEIKSILFIFRKLMDYRENAPPSKPSQSVNTSTVHTLLHTGWPHFHWDHKAAVN